MAGSIRRVVVDVSAGPMTEAAADFSRESGALSQERRRKEAQKESTRKKSTRKDTYADTMGGAFGSFRNLAAFVAASFRLVAAVGFLAFFRTLPNKAAPCLRLRVPPWAADSAEGHMSALLAPRAWRGSSSSSSSSG